MAAIFDFEQWIDWHLSDDNFREIYDLYEVIETQRSSDLFDFRERQIVNGIQYIITSNWSPDVLILKSERQLNAILVYITKKYMHDMDAESFWGLKNLLEKDES